MSAADADYRANPGKYAADSENAKAIAKIVGSEPLPERQGSYLLED